MSSGSLRSFALLSLCAIFAFDQISATNARKSSTFIDDVEEFELLLETESSIMACFVSHDDPNNGEVLEAFEEAAEALQADDEEGAMVVIDCGGAAESICEKFDVDRSRPISLRHFKNGDLFKDYDRLLTSACMVNFMKHPHARTPWDENPEAVDVFHITGGIKPVVDFFKNGPAKDMPTLMMFYAPWCRNCRDAEPDFARAATALKGEACLAAINVDRKENSDVEKLYNIDEVPTYFYYENGKLKYQYDGDNDRDGIVDFMTRLVYED